MTVRLPAGWSWSDGGPLLAVALEIVVVGGGEQAAHARVVGAGVEQLAELAHEAAEAADAPQISGAPIPTAAPSPA